MFGVFYKKTHTHTHTHAHAHRQKTTIQSLLMEREPLQCLLVQFISIVCVCVWCVCVCVCVCVWACLYLVTPCRQLLAVIHGSVLGETLVLTVTERVQRDDMEN